MNVWQRIAIGSILSITFFGCSKPAPLPESTSGPAATSGTGSPAPASGVMSPSTAVSPEAGAEAALSGTAPAPPGPAPVDPNHLETKWIGHIPYDVFYDQPLVVASDSTPVGGMVPPESTPMPMGAESTSPDATASTGGATEASPMAGGKPDWGKVVTLDLAQEAVKVARTEINANLQGIPKYNSGMESIQLNAALMGMLAIVIAEHPESANWKGNAKYVRDLCYGIQGKAIEKGSTAFKATQELFEQVTGILDGGKPPEKESQDSKPYSETADRADMMKIIDKAMNDLKANIGDAKRMKDQSGEITRQLAVMQALGVMMSDVSYEYADNEEYQQFTKALIDGAAHGIEAVKADKYDEFQAALNQMNGSCNECHPKFRGQDSGS